MFHVKLRSGVCFDVPRSDKRQRVIRTAASFNALSNALVNLVVDFLEIKELVALTFVCRMLRDKAQTILVPLAFSEMEEPFKHIHGDRCEEEGAACDCIDEWSRPTPFMVNRALQPTGFPLNIDRVFDFRCFFDSTEFGSRDRNYVLLCSWNNDDGLRVFGFYNASCCYTGFSVIGDMQLFYTDSYEDLMASALTVFQRKELRQQEYPTRRGIAELNRQWLESQQLRQLRLKEDVLALQNQDERTVEDYD